MLRNKLAVVALSLSFLLAGCGSNSSTAVTTPVQPGATLSGTTLKLTSTIGTASSASSITLTNNGNATLTGIAITLGGTNASSFAKTTTCVATLAAGSNCSISVTFTPAAATTYTATISVASSATSTPQTITLTGTGTTTTTPPTPAQAVLSATTIAFPGTAVNSTATAMSVTLSNPGGSTLTAISITLGGTNASDFAETTTCAATLSAGSSCTISATFTPTAAATDTATISVASSATTAAQTITLTGTGTSSTTTVTHKLYVYGPAGGATDVSNLYTFINSATKTIDMTMYELQDTTFTGYLATACGKGIKVRVLLDASLVKSNNTPAYNQLNTSGANCSAVFSNTAFQATHQKTITIDAGTANAQTAIMSLNLQSQYYSTTRDFALLTNDPADIAAIEATFNADIAAGTPYNGTQGPSDLSYQPGTGDDLIWSPTTAQAAMLALINNAQKTITLENEEMGAANIVNALENACQTRGVTVHIAMVNSSTNSPYSSYATQFKALEAAGCFVRTYPDTTTGLYIHAKAVVADYGLGTQAVYMGSINYSNASMTENRELGIYITDTPSVTLLNTTMTNDYAGATAF